MMVILVKKKIAATSPPSKPSQRAPPTPTIVIVNARVASTDGRRTAHSLVPPDNLQLRAIAQLSRGGLRKDGSEPTRGTSQSPEASMCSAGSARRGSSCWS